MRRQNDILSMQKRGLAEIFGTKHVQRTVGNAATVKRSHERRFVHEPASCRIDKYHTRLHALEFLFTDDASCRRS